MKLAISNIAWAAEQDDAIYDLMRKYGYTGLEIAPTRIFPKQPYARLKEATAWRNRLHNQYGFVIPSMQSIWFGRTERIFGSETEQKVLLDYTRQAIDFASAISCHNLVFGCPKNRSMPESACLDTAASFFRKIAEYALACGTVIGFEANPGIYNTNYINTTQEALQLIETVDSAGFRLNLDVGTMLYNNESVEELAGKVKYLSHVHISEPWLAAVSKRQLHRELADCLRTEGYCGFVSVEMAKQESLQPIVNALEIVRNIFA